MGKAVWVVHDKALDSKREKHRFYWENGEATYGRAATVRTFPPSPHETISFVSGSSTTASTLRRNGAMLVVVADVVVRSSLLATLAPSSEPWSPVGESPAVDRPTGRPERARCKEREEERERESESR